MLVSGDCGRFEILEKQTYFLICIQIEGLSKQFIRVQLLNYYSMFITYKCIYAYLLIDNILVSRCLFSNSSKTAEPIFMKFLCAYRVALRFSQHLFFIPPNNKGDPPLNDKSDPPLNIFFNNFYGKTTFAESTCMHMKNKCVTHFLFTQHVLYLTEDKF